METDTVIQKLTRVEQLQWYYSFLEEQIKMYQSELEAVKTELLKVSETEEKKYVKK